MFNDWQSLAVWHSERMGGWHCCSMVTTLGALLVLLAASLSQACCQQGAHFHATQSPRVVTVLQHAHAMAALPAKT